MIKWKLEQRRLGDLVPYENNPRHRNEEGYKQLAQSIAAIGLASVPNITQNNTILSGHQRVALLTDTAGPDHVIDVYVADHALDSKEMQDVVIWLNKAIAGDWNMDFIEEHFDDMDFGKYGFDAPPKKGKTDDDTAPGRNTQTDTKIGDIFTIDNHRIMCGDSTNQAHVDLLMSGQKADLCFIDPPYNVNYEGEGKDTSNKIENDNMAEATFREFLIGAFNSLNQAAKPDAALYCCYASRTHREFEDALNKAGWKVKAQIIWVKLVATMGWADYRWKHEPIFYACKEGGKVDFYGDRKQYTEWTEEKNDEELLKMVRAMIKKDENGGSTVWRFHRDSQMKHPTQKPVQLVMKAIENSSQRGEIVLDLFTGSGSTLIASEKLGRNFFGMELDPLYVDVAVKRIEEFTGKKAVKL